jgi:L-seryl-tRNA(Ser) seleniumtransferase
MVSELNKEDCSASITTTSGFSQMGSGSLPAQNMATTLVAVQPEKVSAESLAKQLRRYHPAIFARIQNDQVLIDPRTLLEGQAATVVQALLDILGQSD